MLAQSIGGGGGVGGSAGSDGSADNPVITALQGREFGSDISSTFEGLNNSGSKPALNLTMALAIGGTGGTGGTGGSVTTDLSAPIATSGDWAQGVVAQSIGGGGGKGGTAAATGTGDFAEITDNFDHAIGGTGGSGGDGGTVQINFNQGVSVATGGPNAKNAVVGGFAASGVVGQSIGGGGGLGGDGTDIATGTITVGGAVNGSDDNENAGGVGNGNTVTFKSSTSGAAGISTSGDAADGVILQSIGGGGGIGGAGSSYWTQNNRPEVPALAPDGSPNQPLNLNVGGGGKANGTGDTVTFDSSNGPVSIATSGYNSFGILAQSIGGGGGLVSATRSTSTQITQLGGLGTGNGGAVNVTLGGGSKITTSGVGAFGIAAQSIGGGGGILRVTGYPGDAPGLSTGSDQNTPQSKPSTGNGGEVTVTVDQNSSISVTGGGAIGIFAQSVGGGGGLLANGNGMYAGTPLQGVYSCSKDCPTGGSVTVNVDGTVSSTGAIGAAVVAQSAGYGSDASVKINVNGTAIGGTYTYNGASAAPLDAAADATRGFGGRAIHIDTPAGSQGNLVTVGSSGLVTTVSGTDGMAILASGGGAVDVTSDGTITGSLFHNGGLFTNRGTYNSGTEVQGRVLNSGTVNLGLPGELRSTHVTGDFTQIGEGRLGVTVDSLNQTAGHLQVDGTATLDGNIAPTALTLLPGALPVVTAGHLTSTADGLDSLLFHWDTAQSGNTLTLAPRSDFKPGSVALNDSQSSLAGYYGRAWTNGDKAFATRFAELSTINDRSDYKAALDAWSSKAAHAQPIALANSAGTILGAAMSCPVFIDDTVQLGEDNCAWAKVTGRWTDQSSTSDTQGYYVSGTTYRIGAQHEIAPDWYLGASFGFGRSWATMDGGSSGDGDTYDGSVTVKRVMGPWQFAGSVAFAGGSFEANRRVDIPGIADETLKSDPSIFLAGGRLRAAYEVAFADWYIRPYGDLDVVYTDLPGFEEKGDDLYALDVHGNSKTSVALSPMVEFGGRLDLDPETALRAYVAFGMSYLPDNTRTIHSSFVGASSANGTFSDQIDSPEVLGRIDVGVQLFRAGGFELKGEYSADVGGSFLSQSASARAAYHF
ncbi:autotransporter outer membrane beta-barrel domain-containing protein [Mycobacterium sp. KBS0706]|nr:autotransporter outer membrane beta-barrel domain-containing protein [Mycobacterium sp. KBS0706]